MADEGLLLSLLAALLAERRELQEQLALAGRVREQETGYLQEEIKHERNLRSLLGESPGMKDLRQAILQVAATDSTVLVLGETGTGKELVARAIHQLSPRRKRLLVSVNCAALNPEVIASELFGHEAGAFTGASKRRVGRFELADQGTIFLDEIAELTPSVQVMLLRVLQERVIERVGGNPSIPVDARVIAATHEDLERLVQEGRFRADLFFRLNVFPLEVPALRERRSDIPALVRHFLHQFNRRMQKRVERVTEEALRLLKNYDWPGNVRELENIVERAMIVAPGNELTIDSAWLPKLQPGRQGLSAVERRTIEDALKRSHGKIYGPGGAAQALGLKPTTLYGKLRKLGINSKR
jgi:formate hydrogenlyase transcriptional activator